MLAASLSLVPMDCGVVNQNQNNKLDIPLLKPNNFAKDVFESGILDFGETVFPYVLHFGCSAHVQNFPLT